DKETAAMVMRMELGLDTGPICLSRTVPISDVMTAGELHDELATTGAAVMVEALAKLEVGSLDCRPQPEDGITYAAKIQKAEARIQFDQPAEQVHNHVRGLSPFPGAWFEVERNGKAERIKVLASELTQIGGTDSGAAPSEGQDRPGTVTSGECLSVQCNPGVVRFTQLQRAGKRPCPAHDLLCGFPLPAGARLC
ncbi:MAG: methionyl-tRNA formyltransferase, partial [Pseudomonadota bacterium]